MKNNDAVSKNNRKLWWFFSFVVLFCLMAMSCSHSDMGWRADIGWYSCADWYWEKNPDPCPPPYGSTPEPPPPIEEKEVPVKTQPVGLQYGYDDIYDIMDDENVFRFAKKVYISLATGGTTNIKINVMNMGFSKCLISTEPSGVILATTTDASGNPTSLLRTDVVNDVTIKSTGSTGSAKLIIKGLNDIAAPTDIAGCDECDKIYIVEVYNMSDINSYQVFNFASNSISPSAIQNGINPFLKQAIGRINTLPVVDNITGSTWDKNGNNLLDCCPTCATDPEFLTVEVDIMFELGLSSIAELNNESFTAILPGNTVRCHYPLTQAIPAGSKTLYVAGIDENDAFFNAGQIIQVGNWMTENSPSYETYTIDSYNASAKTITIKETTARVHSIGETFFDIAAGINMHGTNNNYIQSNPAWSVWLHEMLHQVKYGAFLHVANGLGTTADYSINIMYPWVTGPYGSTNALCGRVLQAYREQNPIKPQRQWYLFHNH